MSAWREKVVPVLGGWAEPLDVWVEANHLSGCRVARKVRIEAAVDATTAIENDTEPGRIGACSSGRDADTVRIEHVTADGIDGGFTEYHPLWFFRTDPEVAGVPSRARRHAAPHTCTGSTQLGADRVVRLSSDQQKDGIASVVRIQSASFNKRLKH